ncbi:MAG: hypothetical protein AAGE61_17470 [Pseudomonadota bacterium]
MAVQKAAPVRSVFLHVKSGARYRVIGYCFLEHNNEAAILYAKHDSGQPEPVWARAAHEFLDGRFRLEDPEG